MFFSVVSGPKHLIALCCFCVTKVYTPQFEFDLNPINFTKRVIYWNYCIFLVGGFKYFYFHPENWDKLGKMNPVWQAYVFSKWVGSTTNQICCFYPNKTTLFSTPGLQVGNFRGFLCHLPGTTGSVRKPSESPTRNWSEIPKRCGSKLLSLVEWHRSRIARKTALEYNPENEPAGSWTKYLFGKEKHLNQTFIFWVPC